MELRPPLPVQLRPCLAPPDDLTRLPIPPLIGGIHCPHFEGHLLFHLFLTGLGSRAFGQDGLRIKHFFISLWQKRNLIYCNFYESTKNCYFTAIRFNPGFCNKKLASNCWSTAIVKSVKWITFWSFFLSLDMVKNFQNFSIFLKWDVCNVFVVNRIWMK